jgi:tetratricopeptide (TPR) repeat protein
MDRRAPESQGRGNVYQSYYNDVRSEYEAIRNAYAEARKHLEDRNFSRALAISDQFLAKYPAHALFQSLKFDAEEQRRLHLSAYIAEIDRRVEAETDLERKAGIINEAGERYPDETHFKHLRKIMDERLSLASTIVAKARYHEENGQFNDALAQWEILRTIHSRYPGLQLEIDRVIKRREQQARMESKSRWAQEIDACMEAGEYRRALDACRRALEESPGDGELQALEELARQGAEHCEEAQRLQARGEQLFAQASFEEGLELLWKAHQLDARSEPIRRSLVDRLSARAQNLLATDWRAAEVLIQHALGCDPAHAGARGVLALLDDLKREEYLNQTMVRIRQAQAIGATQILSRDAIPPPAPGAPEAADAIAGQSGTSEPSRAPAAELEGVPGPHAPRSGRRLPRRARIAAIAVLALAGSLTSWLLLRHRAAPTRLEHKPVTAVTAVPARPAAPALGELHIKVSPPSATQTAELKLTPVKPIVRPPEVFQMDPADWEKPWTPDGEWFTRRGGDFVLYRRTPTAGTFQFTLRAKSKVEWVLDYSDPRNYFLFEIDKQTFTSSEYTNNRRTMITDRKRHGVKTDSFTVNQVVEPAHLVTMLVDEQGKPVTLQDWSRPDRPFTGGRFGIHLPGSSQVWLANFRFTQARPD